MVLVVARNLPKFLDTSDLVKLREKIEFLINSNTNIFFIIGEYGSGKSLNIKKVFIQNSKLPKYEFINLQDSTSLDDAYTNTSIKGLDFLFFILILLLSSGFGYLVSTYEPLNFLAVPIFFFLPFAIAYFTRQTISKFIFELSLGKHAPYFPCIEQRRIIIDDLERSSLSFKEIWIFIRLFNKSRAKTIFLLGYSDTNERQLYIENISKMGKPWIEIFSTYEVNRSYFIKFDNDLLKIINEDHTSWLNEFSTRKVMFIQETVANHPLLLSYTYKKEEYNKAEFVLAVHEVLKAYFNKFNIINEVWFKDLIYYDINGIKVLHFRLSKNHSANSDCDHHIRTLNSFIKSLKGNITFPPNEREMLKVFSNDTLTKGKLDKLIGFTS